MGMKMYVMGMEGIKTVRHRFYSSASGSITEAEYQDKLLYELMLAKCVCGRIWRSLRKAISK